MIPILKRPDALLRHRIVWPAAMLAGEDIVETHWTVAPRQSGGLEAQDHESQGSESIVELAGGVPGQSYRLTSFVYLSDGRSDQRDLVVRVEQG